MESLFFVTLTLEDIDSDIRGILLPGEQIIFIASQSKIAPGGSLLPNSIYITNIRVLFKDPRWFGLKADMLDVSYKDISTVMLKRGVFTTELYFKPHFTNYKVKLPALEKRAAQRISQLIQRGIRGELPGQNQLTVPDIGGTTHVIEQAAEAQQPVEEEEKKPEPSAGNTTITTSCRYCNFIVQSASKFCPECGKSVQIETNIWKVCPSCDAVTSDDAIFCSRCHQRFPDNFLQ
jgi:RNA polymerase subunit RPABC4/transcription elongation factor Spt4